MNKLIEAITASLGEFLNRSFFTAGLAPSLLLTAGWLFYSSGSTGALKLLRSVLASNDDILLSVGWFSFSLGCAWVFVSLQGVLQFLFSEAPIWGLRDRLVRSELQRIDRQRQRLRRALARMGSLNWQESRQRFIALTSDKEEPGKQLSHECIERIKIDSQNARSILKNGEELGPREAARLADSLQSLWEAAKCPKGQSVSAEIDTELKEWTAWLKREPHGEEYLNRAAELAEREVNIAFSRSMEIPYRIVWLRPTRFGNQLAAIDDYAMQRYGIDTSTLWVRLWGVLSIEERTEFRNAQQGVAALINSTAAFGLLTTAILLSEMRDWWNYRNGPIIGDVRAILCILGTLVLSRCSYLAALSAVGSMREVMCRWIDLRIRRLVKELGCEGPRTVAEERALFLELKEFFVQATPREPSRRVRQDGT